MGALVALVPEIGEMLHRNDELVRIVGSKQLLDGVRNHTLHYMQGELGHMTAVVNQQGHIVGHVQLQSLQPSEVIAPAAVVFQVASAITLQYYLQRFDERLAEISSSVRKAREHAAWAQVARAAFEAAEIADILERDGALDADLRARLDAEERAVDVIVIQELLPVDEAARSLQGVRDEIDELLARDSGRSLASRSASALKGTVPGGVRHRLQRSLDELDSAMTHWFIAARAAQVHGTLRSLRAVADQLEGRKQSAASMHGLTERANAQAAVARVVTDLLALPEATYSLFTIDTPIVSRIAALTDTAKWLAVESATAAERLGIAAECPADELMLTTHHGQVVALPTLKVA